MDTSIGQDISEQRSTVVTIGLALLPALLLGAILALQLASGAGLGERGGLDHWEDLDGAKGGSAP